LPFTTSSAWRLLQEAGRDLIALVADLDGGEPRLAGHHRDARRERALACAMRSVRRA
jgi:hypothetical protein